MDSLLLQLNDYFVSEWTECVYLPFITIHLKRLKLESNSYYACENPLLLHFMLNSRFVLDKYQLSRNKSLTMSVIKEYPNIEWGWGDVSCNPGITMQDIINHPQYPWKWDYVSENPNLCIAMIQRYPNKKWDWTSVSCNPEYPWDYLHGVASNPNLRINSILFKRNINLQYSSDNPEITVNDMFAHPELRWCWLGVNCNKSLSIDIINQYPNLDWYWEDISRNPGISMRDIINHPKYPWKWNNVSENPGLTMQIISHFPKKKWCWSSISANPGITIQDIKKHPKCRWHMKYIFGKDFQVDQQMYVDNQIGRLLLVSMYEDCMISFDSVDNLVCDGLIAKGGNDEKLHFVFCSEYHLYHILDYV